MNIFVLDEDPKKAVEYHVDRHVTKMIVETTQLLSTALRANGYDRDDVYKSCFLNHPCSKWTRESRDNFLWLCQLGRELVEEYKFRYDKPNGVSGIFVHASVPKLLVCEQHSNLITEGGMTKFALAMPEQYKVDSFVESYRNYYRYGKKHLHSWKKREKPYWLMEE